MIEDVHQNVDNEIIILHPVKNFSNKTYEAALTLKKSERLMYKMNCNSVLRFFTGGYLSKLNFKETNLKALFRRLILVLFLPLRHILYFPQ